MLLTVLAVLLAAALLLLCRFLYLSRYVVYSGNEAYLDFDRTLSATRDPQQTQNPEDYPFTTLIASQSPDEPQTQQRSKIQGYYITTNMLSDGVDAVRAALDAANDYDAVMIDVKSVFGNYYYRSKLSGAQIATSADIDAVEALIRELTARTDLTVIARVPAFSEPNYAFAHQDQALALYSGALWMDDKRCYWLDPSDASVQSFLASIALELQDLGFDEVLFDQFYFPSSDAINWSSDLGLTRQFLHSYRLSLAHPMTGERLTFADELPWDLAAVLDELADRSLGRTQTGAAILSIIDRVIWIEPCDVPYDRIGLVGDI